MWVAPLILHHHVTMTKIYTIFTLPPKYTHFFKCWKLNMHLLSSSDIRVFIVTKYKKKRMLPITSTAHSVFLYWAVAAELPIADFMPTFQCLWFLYLWCSGRTFGTKWEGPNKNCIRVIHIFSGRPSDLRTQVHWVFSCCFHSNFPTVGGWDIQVLSPISGHPWGGPYLPLDMTVPEMCMF
jgi:hypothetical protein